MCIVWCQNGQHNLCFGAPKRLEIFVFGAAGQSNICVFGGPKALKRSNIYTFLVPPAPKRSNISVFGAPKAPKPSKICIELGAEGGNTFENASKVRFMNDETPQAKLVS